MTYRTRFWSSDQGSSTAVQFRTDTEPMVWVFTNLGYWLPLGNTPVDEREAELMAESIAAGYELTERSQSHALYMAGWVNGEDGNDYEAIN